MARRSMKPALRTNTNLTKYNAETSPRIRSEGVARSHPRVHVGVFRDITQGERSGLLLDILDVGEGDALGAFLCVAEIEFVPGEENRITIDVIGHA